LSKNFPCSQHGNPQKYRDQLDCYASPSRPGHSFATQQGVAHMLSSDSTRYRKACISTTLSLRGNTCTIASGDYSTPVSQRWMIGLYDRPFALPVYPAKRGNRRYLWGVPDSAMRIVVSTLTSWLSRGPPAVHRRYHWRLFRPTRRSVATQNPAGIGCHGLILPIPLSHFRCVAKPPIHSLYSDSLPE
jgi:hypothetical protein